MIPSGFCTLIPHRLLHLDDSVFMMAERGSAWAELDYISYSRIVNYFNEPVLLPVSDVDWQDAAESLWRAGLLAVEAKTIEYAPQLADSFPSSLLIKLTGTCNFACTYCYDYDEKRFSKQLDLARIKETIDFLLSRRNDLTLAFHGGEPLLRFAVIRAIVTHALAVAKPNGKVVRFSIQTNGSRFTDDVIDFLEHHNFSIGISLDGSTPKANGLRQVRSGPSLMEHIEKLMTERLDFVRNRCGFLAVISKASIDGIHDFAVWLQDHGVRGLSFSFLDSTGAALTDDDNSVTPQQAVQMFSRFIELIDSRVIWDIELKSILGRIDNLYRLVQKDFCHKGPCAAASDFLVLDAEGHFRSCDCIYDPFFEMPEADADISNVGYSPSRARIVQRHDWLATTGECSECPLFGICGGTCAAKSIAINGTPNSVDPIECALSKFLYPKFLREFSAGKGPLISYYEHHRPSSSD